MKKKQTRESLLIGAIWGKLGGQYKVAARLGISQQLANWWRSRGAVPLKRVHEVASKLKVPIVGLNYRQLKMMFDTKSDWAAVVKSYKLSKEVEASLIKLDK